MDRYTNTAKFAAVFSATLLLTGTSSAAVTATTVVSGLTTPQAVVVAGSNVYFVSGVGGSLTISSVPTSGGAITSLYSGIRTGNGLAVIGNTLFMIDANSGPVTDTQILSGPLAGAPSMTAIYTGALVGQPIVDGNGITTDGTHLFTSDEVQGRVHSLNPDGSALTQLGPNRYGGFFDTEHGNWITNEGGVVYVLDGGRPSVISPQVVSIPAGGGTFTSLWVGAPFVTPNAIVAANGTLYIADGSTIYTMPESGGPPTVFYSGSPFVNIAEGGLSFADNALYVADSTTGVITKLTNTPPPPPGTDIFSGLTNPLFGGTPGNCPTGWICGGSPDPGFASYAPTTAQYPGGSPFATAAFSPTVYGGSGIVRQLTSLTWQGGTTYLLNLQTGLPNTEPDGSTPVGGWPQAPNGAARLYLTMGDGFGQVAAFDIPSPAPGTFASDPISFTLPVNSSAVGQKIGVMIFVSAPSSYSANFAITAAN